MDLVEAQYLMESTVGDPELPELRDLLRRPARMAQAACRGSQTTFFPDRGGSVTEATETSLGCPVRTECLAFALADPEVVGVWGAPRSGNGGRCGEARPE